MVKSTIAQFYRSTEEDLRFRYTFENRSFTGRTLRINVREIATNDVKYVLNAPANLTIGSSGVPGFPDNDVAAQLPLVFMAAWPVGEYEVDLLDITTGSATRIVAGRVKIDLPGELVYGVAGNQATVRMEANQAIITATGGVGLPGPANVITIGDVVTLAPGQPATAELTGESPNQELNLGIPRGNTGATGTAATVAVGTVSTGAPGSPASVVNAGTPGAAVFNFAIPQGIKGDKGSTGAGGATSEFLVAAGIPEQPSIVVDAIRDEYFAAGSLMSTALPPFIAAVAGSSFTRASTATYFGRDGLLKTAAINAPRIDYDPVTRQRLGLLMENASRTNLLTYSEQIDNATWQKTNVTVTADAGVSPAGTSTMDKVVETNGAGLHSLTTANISANKNAVYTYSAFVKAAGRTKGQIQINAFSGNQIYCQFDLATGVVSGDTNTGTATGARGAIVPVGNDVYRVSISGQPSTEAATGIQAGILLNNGASTSYTGDGTSGMFVWGGQLEAGAGASSYIPTVAATVTRAADALTLGAAAWLAGTALSALIEFRLNEIRGSGAISYPVRMGDSLFANNLAIREGAVITGADLVSAATTTQIDSGSYATPVATNMRFAFGADAAGYGFAKDNVISITSGSAISHPVGMDRILLGASGFMGHIRRAMVFQQRLSNAKVQALSGIEWPIVSAHPGTIAVGTVTTGAPLSPASVVNVGTDAAAVFNFTIPQGDQGPPGSVSDGAKNEITVSAGGTSWSINNDVVTNAKMANMATATIKGRLTAGSGDPEDLTPAQARAVTQIDKWNGARNLAINSTFALNQRAFAGGALAAGVYGHDRWKADTGGANYSVSGGVATIASGALVQPIEGISLLTGNYVINWEGTSPVTIDGVAKSKGDVVSLTAGTNCIVKAGVGTFSKFQLEFGSVPTAFEIRHYGHELMLCQRYYVRLGETGRFTVGSGMSTSSLTCLAFVPLPVPMRAIPTLSMSNVAQIAADSAGGTGGTTAVAIGSTAPAGRCGIDLAIITSGAYAVPTGVLVRISANHWIAFDAEI